jgi:IMP cyclohydrolase
MPTTYKVLGQSNPSVTTETILYTTPSLTQAVVSSIAICNQAATSATFRVAVRPSADASTTAKHYLVYGTTVAANDTIILTMGITLAASDKILVYASTGNISFAAYGSELV